MARGEVEMCPMIGCSARNTPTKVVLHKMARKHT